jgi:Flp pilus assembly protein TadD
LLLLTAVAYLPALGGDFVWDDYEYLATNKAVQASDGLLRIWTDPSATPQYYPLVFSSFWLEYRLWGLHTSGYHWTNILLHGLNAVLVWLVLRRLQVPGAWFAAALFALHPVHVESVAWIAERKNVLSGMFFGLALLSFFRFSPPIVVPSAPLSDDVAGAKPHAGTWGWYVLSLVLFVCALFSKTVTCSLPAVIVLLLLWKRGTIPWREGLALAPMFALGLGLALVTISLEKEHVGASGADWAFSFVERCLIAGRALWFYAGKLLFPFQLAFIYPRWQIDGQAWWQYLFPLGALIVLGVLWLKGRRLGFGPLTACLYFAGCLFPALGFFNVYPHLFSFVADHFQYLASVGLLTLLGAGAALLGTRMQPLHRIVVASCVLLALGALTWRQARIYENQETVWRDTLDKNPDCWMAHYNLGNLISARGFSFTHPQTRHAEFSQAAEHFARAVALRPSYARAHCNLGVALAQVNDVDRAVAHIRTAVELDEREPSYHFNLGHALALQGKTEEALAHFRRSVALQPDHAEAHVALGMTLSERKQIEDAVAHFQAALAGEPRSAVAAHELGKIYLQQEKLSEAAHYLGMAVELQPAVPRFRYDLATALQKLGRGDDASEHLREAYRLEPNAPVR